MCEFFWLFYINCFRLGVLLYLIIYFLFFLIKIYFTLLYFFFSFFFNINPSGQLILLNLLPLLFVSICRRNYFILLNFENLINGNRITTKSFWSYVYHFALKILILHLYSQIFSANNNLINKQNFKYLLRKNY